MACGIPASITAIGNSRPITPVEQTSICRASWPSAPAARAVMRRASSRPCWPVQALALPEQMTMPRTSLAGSRSRQTWTGAAQTRFCVKVPAATAGKPKRPTLFSVASSCLSPLAGSPSAAICEYRLRLHGPARSFTSRASGESPCGQSCSRYHAQPLRVFRIVSPTRQRGFSLFTRWRFGLTERPS